MTATTRRRDTVQEFRFLGVRVSAMTVSDWLGAVEDAIETRRQLVMVGQNLHSVYLAARDERLRELQERADHIRVDGIPLILIGRLLGYPLKLIHRSGFMDLYKPLMLRAREMDWKIYYLGARPEVLERGLATIRASFPGIAIRGSSGYFDPSDPNQSVRIIEDINRNRTDLLIVGMGMPRQEHWILENLCRIDASAIVASGAAMDYIAGAVPMAPRWLSSLGLEWIYRLLQEPRRLWHRYLIEPLYVIRLVGPELIQRLAIARRGRQ
jgi:N-acetylglucosaminyldiphosphoundecaprenol N-acetyl-beta-D-mannosaminyltransferase